MLYIPKYFLQFLLHFLTTIALLATSFLPSVLPAQAGGFDELEAVVAQAETIEQFLANEELIEQYFKALHNYYGDKMVRRGFDLILTQLRTIVAQNPEFGRRLWQSLNQPYHFTIQPTVKSYGRDANPARWRTTYADWLARLRTASGPLAEAESADLALRPIFDRVERMLAQGIAQIEASGETKAQKGKLRNDLYQRVREDEQYRQAASLVLYQYLNRQDVKNLLCPTSGEIDANLVLDALASLKQKPAIALSRLEVVPPEGFVNQLKAIVPDLKFWHDQEGLFVQRLRQVPDRDNPGQTKDVPEGVAPQVPYVFDSVPRGFHGIWEGIWNNECVAGGFASDQPFGTNLSPNRWGAMALEGAARIHIRRGSSFMGYIQIAPVMRTSDPTEVYESIEFWAPILKTKFSWIDAQTGEAASAYFFDLALSQLRARIPAEIRGFGVSSSGSVGHSGVLPAIKSTPTFTRGLSLGVHTQFQPQDPYWRTIVGFPNIGGKWDQFYAGAMAMDVTVNNWSGMTNSVTILHVDPCEQLLENNKAAAPAA